MGKVKVTPKENAWDIDERFAQLLLWFELNKNNGDFARDKKYQKLLRWLRKASKFDRAGKKDVYFRVILKSIDEAYERTRPLFEDTMA